MDFIIALYFDDGQVTASILDRYIYTIHVFRLLSSSIKKDDIHVKKKHTHTLFLMYTNNYFIHCNAIFISVSDPEEDILPMLQRSLSSESVSY